MFILETEAAFDSAHFLSGYDGKCSNLHGHRWRIVAHIAKNELQPEGQMRDMVLDFGDFKNALTSLADQYDHTMIIEKGTLKASTLAVFAEEGFSYVEVPFRPTAERFSQFFYQELKKMGFPVIDISVYETPTNCATYRED